MTVIRMLLRDCRYMSRPGPGGWQRREFRAVAPVPSALLCGLPGKPSIANQLLSRCSAGCTLMAARKRRRRSLAGVRPKSQRETRSSWLTRAVGECAAVGLGQTSDQIKAQTRTRFADGYTGRGTGESFEEVG